MFEFLDCDIQNHVKIDEERIKSRSLMRSSSLQTMQARFQLQQQVSRTYTRTSCSNVKSSDFRVFASESRYKIAEKSAVTCSTASHASLTLFATSRSQIFSTKMSSRSVSFKDSHLSIATLKITSKSLKKLSINCSFISSLSSSRIFVRKHQELHMQKSYLTMNDLSRMFDEKFKSFDLQQHQNSALSSRSFDIRQFHSIKFYLTIENLFEMFNEKFRKKSLFQNQKNVSFREFFSEESRITIYFKSTINQKSSISQNSKSSKSKSLKQHTSAKFIRIALLEKSFILFYKMSSIFYFKSRVFLQSRFSSRFSLTWFSLTSSSFSRSSLRDLHVYYICFDQFNFNNDLHKHLRTSLEDHSSCQFMRAIK